MILAMMIRHLFFNITIYLSVLFGVRAIPISRSAPSAG
jgi:hypothetical protein